MSYHIIHWTVGNTGIYKKEGTKYRLLARRSYGIWMLAREKKYLQNPEMERICPITEEEVAMILFQCRE